VVRATRFGNAFDFVSAETATLAGVLLDDDEAFGRPVRALDPWLTKRTTLDVLEAEVDPGTVATVRRLTEVIAKQAKELRPQLEAINQAGVAGRA
jgi:hypothetical protein